MLEWCPSHDMADAHPTTKSACEDILCFRPTGLEPASEERNGEKSEIAADPHEVQVTDADARGLRKMISTV